MTKKTIKYIGILAGIAILLFIAWHFFKEQRKRFMRSIAQNAQPPKNAGTPITPEVFEEIIKKKPRLAAKFTGNLYNHLKQHAHLLDTSEQKEYFKKWLETQRTEILKNKEYRKNLEYWLEGVTDNPEASVMRAFRQHVANSEKAQQIFKREPLKRAAKNFGDDAVEDDPTLDVLPSVFDEFEAQQQTGTDENSQMFSFFY